MSTFQTTPGGAFNAHTIYCDTDPALKDVSTANRESFASVQDAQRAHPDYQLKPYKDC